MPHPRPALHRALPLLAGLIVGLTFATSAGCGLAQAGRKVTARRIQWRDALQPPTHRDLAYVPNGHARQKLDLYLPEKRKGKLPLILWVHGGGWEAGSKLRCPARVMLSRGYAVASVGYRLSSDAKFPAQIEDCRAAVRFLRRNASQYGLDGERFAAWGGSAGGHLVSLLGTASERKAWDRGEDLTTSVRVQAVVDWYGPSDLTQGSRYGVQTISRLLGGHGPAFEEVARDASPLRHVTKDDAPFLIVHGDKDGVVPIAQSQKLAEALKGAGVASELVVLPGAGHGGPQFTEAEELERIDRFLRKHLNLNVER